MFLGTAAAPTPMPSGTPEPMAVDLWTWHDDVLQSQQKHDADRERKRTYLAVYDVAAKRFAQLGSPSLRDVTTRGERRRRARRGRPRLPPRGLVARRGLCATSTRSRSKTAAAACSASASAASRCHRAARYALAWDEGSRHWVATRTADGRRVVLGAHAGVAFHDVDDDHPAPPQPYGIGGWLDGDRGVLLYDEYDVWLANPDTGDATNVTRGEGRRTRTVFSPVQHRSRRRRVRAERAAAARR